MPPSNVPGLEKYDQRVADLMLDIESTPTGRPYIAWVREHKPRIDLGKPITGGGFTYPWPLDHIVITPEYDDEWLRQAIAHELLHLVKYGGPGTLFGSLEQEREAAWVSAKVWTEFPPGDATSPQDRPGYPDWAGWVLDQSPALARKNIRETWGGFYQSIPELQPGPWPWQQLIAGWPQIVYAIRLMLHRDQAKPARSPRQTV